MKEGNEASRLPPSGTTPPNPDSETSATPITTPIDWDAAKQCHEGKVKIDENWNYDKTWTRMKGETTFPQPANTLKDILQAIGWAFELLSNQSTRGAPETCKKEVMQRLKNTHKDLKTIIETTPIATSSAENNQQTILDKLEAIQASVKASVSNLERKYETLQTMVTSAPKDYVDAVKSTVASINEKSKEKTAAELQARRRTHKEKLRKEQAKYEVTLTMKEMNNAMRKSIMAMTPQKITERCQLAIDSPDLQLNGTMMSPTVKPKIQGIVKLANGIRIKCKTEEEATMLRNSVDWSKAFQYLRVHQPNYGVVLHGVPTEEFNLTHMEDEQVIQDIEEENGMKISETIVRIAPLCRKNKDPNNYQAKLHQSIVIFMKDRKAANKCLKNGCYINCLHYTATRFMPQFKVTQCFNCYDYGHRAIHCKREARCGKCGDSHNTKECKNTTTRCVHCKGDHHAWCQDCPAWISEKERLDELAGNASDEFD